MQIQIANRWWVYQRERFPVLAHSPLILAFSSSALCYSTLLRGVIQWPELKGILTAFITSTIFFLQLRIADEFKDYEEDSRWRPYRPVPRGLIKLSELRLIGVMGALTQLGLALWLKSELAILLIATWIYLTLMSCEFFIRAWIKSRPITYLWTHMLIVPLVDFYATACDWMPVGKPQPSGLGWFLLVSFCNGIVIEIGRKLRAPEDEEEGVETYTVLWGRKKAVMVWLTALIATGIFAVLAGLTIDFALPLTILLMVFITLSILVAVRFWQSPESKRARLFETISGFWTLSLYLSLGVIPMFVKLRGRL